MPSDTHSMRDNGVSNNTKKDVIWQHSTIGKSDRAKRFGQKPAIIWLTGLSGSGKSTLADALEQKLHSLGYSTYSLDGDNIRHGLCSDLGFGDEDRAENIRRVGEVAKLFVDAGFIVIASFVSPFIQDREMVRKMVELGEFVEVYVNASFEECEKRDPKGLYKKARAGEIKNFTGLESPYEKPLNSECEIDTVTLSVQEAIELLTKRIKELGVI